MSNKTAEAILKKKNVFLSPATGKKVFYEESEVLAAMNEYASQLQSTPQEGYSEEFKGWVALFKDEPEYLEYLKWKGSKSSVDLKKLEEKFDKFFAQNDETFKKWAEEIDRLEGSSSTPQELSEEQIQSLAAKILNNRIRENSFLEGISVPTPIHKDTEAYKTAKQAMVEMYKAALQGGNDGAH